MATEEELVSVIIPAYNAEAYLDETLRSVRSQTHCPLEIVIVDDGSLDATCAIAGSHARVDPRVRLLSQANSGVAAARNLGIANTRGRYIAPVDADDLWAPTKIKRQLDALRSVGPTEFRSLPPDDPRQRQPDIAAARQSLDWEPKVQLRKGLEETIGFFRELISRSDVQEHGP